MATDLELPARFGGTIRRPQYMLDDDWNLDKHRYFKMIGAQLNANLPPNSRATIVVDRCDEPDAFHLQMSIENIIHDANVRRASRR